MIKSTICRLVGPMKNQVRSKYGYNVCNVWMSVEIFNDQWTRSYEEGLLALLVDLGRRLKWFERETFFPMFGVDNDAIIDVPKEAIAGTSRVRVSFLTCERMSYTTLYPKTLLSTFNIEVYMHAYMHVYTYNGTCSLVHLWSFNGYG